MTDLAACTIIAHNYLPLARVLAESFLLHHPGATFYIVIVDRPTEARLIRDEAFTVVPITDIDFGDEGFGLMATIYDVTEFSTAVKPFALRHLVQHHDCVLYIDPDIKVFAPLDPLVASTVATGWSLTPHCLEPIERDGTGPTERDIMQAGIYNLGYIGVTKSSVRLLDWWSARLRRDSISDPANQLFTDQRWIDLAVPIFAPHIERNPAYNVAYWNIDQRHLWRDGDTLMVGDDLLRFFHFSGYSPANPHWLSKYQPLRPRVLMSENPVLAEMCVDYGNDLLRTASADGKIASYGWAEAFPGFPLTRSVRQMFRRELLDAEANGRPLPPAPFGEGGIERFTNWLLAMVPDSPRRLPRYLSAIYDERTDLQQHFSGVERGDNRGFETWVANSGPNEYRSIALLGWPTSHSVANVSGAIDGGREPGGVDLVGYLQAELGVGEAGRLLASALEAIEVPVSTVTCRRTVSRQDHPFESAGVAKHDTVIMAVNADELANVRHEFGSAFFDGRYVIGQWFWELEQFPHHFDAAFDLVDEVWAATSHMQAAIERNAPEHVSVQLMPIPLVAPAVAEGLDKASFGLEDRFTFLFSFDFMSVVERKNPTGLLEAFMQAFAPNEGPVLVVKTINGHRRLDALERLRWQARDRSDIVIIDGYFDHGMSGALMAACDSYVSLHRAEGLGLTMSEAMALGKPVIATAYSGNVDFMTDSTAILIPAEPILIGSKAAPYDPTSSWVQPDLVAAAAAMRRLVDDPTLAVAIGSAAAAHLRARFSPEVCGARMQQRLTDIRRMNHAR